MEKLLKELVDKLRKTHGEKLVSVIVYGSGAEPETRDPVSDYNVVCVLQRVTPAELADSEVIFRWWRERKNPAPVLLALSELQKSTDCFPMEFHDMVERHRIVYGDDVIAGLAIHDTFYRAQVEHQLRSGMLRLRQKAAGVLAEKDLLMRLLCDSVSTFCVLFRHALRLSGEGPKFTKREVIEAARQRFGIATEPFETLLDLRERKRRIKDVQDPVGLFSLYLDQIYIVVDTVDHLEK